MAKTRTIPQNPFLTFVNFECNARYEELDVHYGLNQGQRITLLRKLIASVYLPWKIILHRSNQNLKSARIIQNCTCHLTSFQNFVIAWFFKSCAEYLEFSTAGNEAVTFKRFEVFARNSNLENQKMFALLFPGFLFDYVVMQYYYFCQWYCLIWTLKCVRWMAIFLRINSGMGQGMQMPKQIYFCLPDLRIRLLNYEKIWIKWPLRFSVCAVGIEKMCIQNWPRHWKCYFNRTKNGFIIDTEACLWIYKAEIVLRKSQVGSVFDLFEFSRAFCVFGF